ncbi:MAG: 7,8-didemethyl-8-hydroxy-5-deazariboflavin synthase subunit CofG [Candidatus Margulisbacteria bacterium]|nr:7,8-didemethyl-8-hydroxy-5-deazariboflavin synthase subunit CofG [Candidatus Margulisiibacteriota bacterium]
MVVGYSLGNKSVETDIQVVGEDSPDVITYSRSMTTILTRKCRNNCPYCGFHKNENLAVPYGTIKPAKQARKQGVREILFVAGERPDKFPDVRATLDLWGFSSYLDYVYTVCELGFLEGLIPVLEVGFLSPIEMKKMQEICALMKIMLDTVDDHHFEKIYPKSPGKRKELRYKSLEWAGKLGIPTITGLMVGIGESKDHRRKTLNHIAKVQKEFGHIHEVLIQNFVPEPGTRFENKTPPKHKVILDTVEMALSILPDSTKVTIPIHLNTNIEDFIKAGIRDLGRIEDPRVLFPHVPELNFQNIAEIVNKEGFRLQQRFPIRFSYIKDGRYSSKLGQVFEAIRYKITKDEQERLKEKNTA